MNSQLVGRYLQAVKFWLPKAQQEDIAAELSEDLYARIEERQAELARPLEEAEVATLLKQNGSPVLVASRYLPQRSLIGPVLYPVYIFMLKMMALFYLLPWLLVAIALAAFHSNGNTIDDSLGAFFKVTVTSFAAMTLAFALLERFQAQTRLFDQWDPQKLPAVRTHGPGYIKRSSSIAEIIANLFIALWWIDGMWTQTIFHGFGVRITLLPVWQSISWALLILVFANVTVAAFNLFRPYWTRPRAILRLAIDCCGSFLFCWLLKAQVLASIDVPNLTPAKASALVALINAGMLRGFPLAVIISLFTVGIADLPRLFRRNPAAPAWSATESRYAP